MSCLNQMLYGSKKNISLLLSVLLLTMTVAIFGPLELYFTNYEEFWFASKDVALIAVILAGGCFIIFIAIGLLLRGKARKVYSAILFAIGLALYIQGNYANIDYGELNGEAINWNAYPVYAVVDTLIWLGLIVGALFLFFRNQKLFYKIQKIGSLWIIVIQVITLGVLLMTTNVSEMKKSDYYLSSEGMYDVSSEENIVIFVLDAFDDTYFQEIVKEEPEKYQTIFEDFVHYNNATAGAAFTKLGMPAIITGERYPGEITYTEYINQSFNDDGLYTTMQKQNYDVRIYTDSTYVPDKSSSLVNNQVSTGYVVSSYPNLTQKYLSLTLYKYMPHILKRFFWLYTGEFDQYRSGSSAEGYIVDDVAFFDNLQSESLSVNTNKNIFRLFHLNGTHLPITMNENVQLVDEQETSILQQGKGVLHIVETYINILKQLDVYDEATIVVMADHGSMARPEHGLLLVKESGHKGAYSESAAPVSYFDLHATLFRVLGMEKGQTFVEIPEGNRMRYFDHYGDEAGHMIVTEYIVEGNINENNAVRPTGIVLQPMVKNEHYRYGTELFFGEEGNTVLPYIVSGVSTTDTGSYSWTSAKECEFQFEFEDLPKKNLLVTLDVMAISSVKESQDVICYANDEKCFNATLFKGTQLQFVIPGTVLEQDKMLNLRIELPDAASPAEVAGGADVRILALALHSMRIDETDENITVEELKHYDFGE